MSCLHTLQQRQKKTENNKYTKILVTKIKIKTRIYLVSDGKEDCLPRGFRPCLFQQTKLDRRDIKEDIQQQ